MKKSRYLVEQEVEIKGNKRVFTFLKSKDAVAILPITKEGNVVLVKQLRVPVGQEILEIPAGGIEEGEEPIFSAQRELREETGYIGGNWTHITTYYTSPGITTETMHVFRAELTEQGELDLDEGEDITLEEMTLTDALQAIESGKIVDGKTIIALFSEQIIRNSNNGYTNSTT